MIERPRKSNRRLLVFLIPFMLIFIPLLIGWFRNISFAEEGSIINAIFLVSVTLVLPAAIGWMIWTGKLRKPESEYLERGYIETPALSRSRPGVVLPLVGMVFLLLLGSLALKFLTSGMISTMFKMGLFSLIFLPVLIPVFMYTYLLLYLFARFWVNRRIARLMAGGAFMERKQEPVPEVELPKDGFRCTLISSLPEGERRKQAPTSDSNCLGLTPLKLLYLWNFDVGWPKLDIPSWCQYGSVYWLWGPANIPASQYFSLASSGDTKSRFASTEADVTRWLERAEGNQVRGFFRRRYREYPIACQANIWKSAVSRACETLDAVVLDARGYTPVRSGLTWEIGHVVRNVPVERFIILADITTAIRCLVNTINAVSEPGSEPVTARIVYPPLLRPAAELKQLFSDEKVPYLHYQARFLVHLFVNEPPERGELQVIPPL